MQVAAQISGRQRRLYDFIRTYQAQEGRPPTYAEMQHAVGISSKSLVRYHLDVLVRRGFLDRAPATARGVRPRAGQTDTPEGVIVPVVGDLPAGARSTRVAGALPGDGVSVLALTHALVPDDVGLYALRVRGDALWEALLQDGDLVVVRPQENPRDGELVAVRLHARGGEEPREVVRRWYREPAQVRLEADAPGAPPLYAAPQGVTVRGSVVAVIRAYAPSP